MGNPESQDADRPRRSRGLVAWFLIGVVFLQAGSYAAYRARTNAISSWGTDNADTTSILSSSKSVIPGHPIPRLMADAEARFRTKLSKQSRTLKAAVAEYRRRYKRDPPLGFDAWWAFAQENGVKLVDEYDGLVADLEPFWALTGRQVRDRAAEAGRFPFINLVRIMNGQADAFNAQAGADSEDIQGRAAAFVSLVKRHAHLLPDMIMPVNSRGEGRVLVPWDHREDPAAHPASPSYQELIPDWRGDGNVWEAFRRSCDPSSPSRKLYSALRPSNLVTNSTPSLKTTLQFHPGDSITSFCQIPWAHYTQGHFFSDWRTITGLYPIFSAARAPGFSDIRIPSHYYYWPTFRHTYGFDPVNLVVKEHDDTETPWELKTNKIYWRGPTTGGGGNPPGHAHQFHRHRFLRMSSSNSTSNTSLVFADPPSSSNWVSAHVPIGELNKEIMDAAFVKDVYADVYPGGLEALHADHRWDDAVSLGEHWRHKYLLDMDGMGYSAKFFAILESDSAALKATIYEEFYSDWIQPWLHFIPLSPFYQEVYNIHAFFSGPTEAAALAANASATYTPPDPYRPTDGDKRLRRIARAGKQWKRTIGREVDMEAYVFRLCLEFARISSDDRDAMSYKS